MVVLFSTRERARAVARAAFPRRRARLLLAKTPEELEQTFRSSLVDAAIVDLAGAREETWRAAQLAREFPSVPFFGLTPLRASESPALAQCAALDFADVLVESVDDTVAPRPRAAPGLLDAIRRRAVRSAGGARPVDAAAAAGVAVHRRLGGRPVRTQLLADALGVTREHLSRTFAAEGAPNLKRVIDLVRLIAAAELAKNPGYDVRDVAEVLDFASSSHLSSTAQRIVGTKPASLARLRAVDWSSGSRGGTDGVAGSRTAAWRRPRPARAPISLGDLTVEVDEVAGEQACDLPAARSEVAERASRDQFGLPRDGELGLEPKQRALGREVGFALLGGRGPGEPVGDVRARRRARWSSARPR